MDAPPHGPRGLWMAAVSFPEGGNESGPWHIAKRSTDPARPTALNGKLTPNMEHDSGRLSSQERSVSYIVVAILTVALIRLALVCVYPKRANWDIEAAGS